MGAGRLIKELAEERGKSVAALRQLREAFNTRMQVRVRGGAGVRPCELRSS